mgnify:CR=1 FL=1
MMKSDVRIIRFARYHALLVPILLLAAFLRIYEADTEFFGGDDAYISIKAIQIARYGETHLLGPPSSLGLVHSPLSVYLYAIPYLFSPDPRNAQVFTGLRDLNGFRPSRYHFITDYFQCGYGKLGTVVPVILVWYGALP